MKKIYISRNGSQEGPFTEQEIRASIATHQLSRDDFAWYEGMSDWQPLSIIFAGSKRETGEDDFVPENMKSAKANHSIMEEVDGTLHVYDDRLTITPKGILSFLNRGLQGAKTIYFHSITAIQLKRAGITRGYLQFTIPGGNESQKGVLAAVSDENTFLFDALSNHRAEEVKNYIEARMNEIRAPKPATSSSLSDELSKLADLKKQGILSDEEFQTAKKRLIG